MIKSMTGFGKSEFQNGDATISVEIQAVNNRFFDTLLRMPDFFESYGTELKKILKTELVRGRISVFIKYSKSETESEQVVINESLVKEYLDKIENLRSKLNLDQTISLEHLLELPDAVKIEMSETNINKIFIAIKKTMLNAILDLQKMRLEEGKHLANDIIDRLIKIEDTIQEINNESNQNKNENYQKYCNYLKEICADIDINEDRVIQEAAIISKKMDITEECTRLFSHIQQFRKYLDNSDDIGKKMTFILQEMNREVTTIGSKCESAEISHKVVDVKNELEKIREQAQNIL